jgi:hypothetical protein
MSFASINPDAGMAIAQNSGVNFLLQASGAVGFIDTRQIIPWFLEQTTWIGWWLIPMAMCV